MATAPLFLPSKVIVHHSDTVGNDINLWPIIREYHLSKGWREIGYHAGVCYDSSDYEIVMGRPWDMDGAHTLGQNDKSLGICFLGNYSSVPPPQSMLITGAKLIAYWCRHFNIPTTEITKHSNWNNTECPGDAFPMDTLRQFVEAAL